MEQGDYLYSELLPSENNLIGIYDCSRNSICRAIAGLVKDGYVQAVHGKGVQVIFQPSEKTNFTVGGIESFRETAARNQMTYCTKVVVYETITVDGPSPCISRNTFPSTILLPERKQQLNK